MSKEKLDKSFADMMEKLFIGRNFSFSHGIFQREIDLAILQEIEDSWGFFL